MTSTENSDGVRYSTGTKPIGDAKNFSWEHPIPENAFWNNLSFSIGRNFLTCFTEDEIAKLPIDPNSTQTKTEKLHLLLRLLREKLAAEDAAASPKTFYDVDYDTWSDIGLGIFTLQHELKLPEAEETIRMLHDKRQNKANLSHQHTLSGLYLEKGQYAEAEELERPVLDWLVGRLGATSPQALGSRRMLAQAAWKLGREQEGRKLLEETLELVKESGSGKYAVYEDEQREMTEKMVADLESGRL